MKAQWSGSGPYVNTAAPPAHYTLNGMGRLHYPAGGSSSLYCTVGALLVYQVPLYTLPHAYSCIPQLLLLDTWQVMT